MPKIDAIFTTIIVTIIAGIVGGFLFAGGVFDTIMNTINMKIEYAVCLILLTIICFSIFMFYINRDDFKWEYKDYAKKNGWYIMIGVILALCTPIFNTFLFQQENKVTKVNPIPKEKIEPQKNGIPYLAVLPFKDYSYSEKTKSNIFENLLVESINDT
ncbi:MAG TPA: hypothetical protein VGE24_02385, partial [Emticicia sp.]